MRAAVLGRPITHSLSPMLHRAAYTALGLDWTYTAIECADRADLLALLTAAEPWAGFSCTMPLKHVALAVADEIAPAAAAVGAANTLLPRPDGGWRADNTDVDGIVAALRPIEATDAVVIGAGGTAQAVVVALAALGFGSLTALVRSEARAAGLIDAGRRAGVTVGTAPYAADSAVLGAPLVISTVPRGVADALAGWGWTSGQTVFDVIYEPWPTALARAAADGGARVVSGALMLLHQAARQVELMTGRPAPVEAMRRALAEVAPTAGL